MRRPAARLAAALAVLALPVTLLLLAPTPAAALKPPVTGTWDLTFHTTGVRTVGRPIPRGNIECPGACSSEYQFVKAGAGQTTRLFLVVDAVGCTGVPCDVRAVGFGGTGFQATLHYDGTTYSGTGEGFFGADTDCPPSATLKGTDSIRYTVSGPDDDPVLTGTLSALLSVVHVGADRCKPPDGYEIYSGDITGTLQGTGRGATGPLATGAPGALAAGAAGSADASTAGSAPGLSAAALAALPAERRADILADRAHSRPALSTRVASAKDLPWRPSAVLTSALLALVLVVLMPFPAALFNGTLEHHYDEVRGWFRFLPAREKSPDDTTPLEATTPVPASRTDLWRNLGLLALATAVLNAFLDPHLAVDKASAILVAGLALSVLAVSVLGGVPLRSYVRRRYAEPAHLALRPLGFAVAAVCVLVSRLVSFQPGYLYGVVAGFAFARELEREEKGRIHATTAAWLLGVAVVAFAVRIPVHHALATSDGAVETLLGLVDTVLAAVFAAGVEGNVLGLLPVRFLAGEEVLAWSRRGWAVIFGLSMFAFLHALSAEAGAASTGTSAAVAVALFGAFGTVSVAFWAYFRFRPAHPTPASV